MSIDKTPKWIEPKDQKTGDMRIVLQNYLMQYTFCLLTYETTDGQEWNIRLKVPVNTLMFCKPLEEGPDKFKEKLEEYKDKKAGAMIELDRERINSLSKLRETLALDGAVKVYPTFDQVKGRVYAGTQFDTTMALVQVDITPTNPPQCSVVMYCPDDVFRAVVMVSVADILGRIKASA